MSLITRISTTLLLSLALIACGGDPAENAGNGEAADAHVHGPDCEHDAEAETTGPHGGALAAIGDGAVRLEALHDDVLGQVTAYILDAENGMLTLDQPPVLNLVTDAGSAQVKPTAIGGAWVFEHDALTAHPEKARFRIAIAGKTYTVDMPCSHEHEGAHGPHDGVPATFADGLGHLELKLHDDKGDLELWLTKDAAWTSPYDLPVDARITVKFIDHDGRDVALAVRNREQNEDEDGKPNLRDGKTNYFIFPGDTGVDAAWLTGAEFVSRVTVTIEADGKTFVTQPFELRPHTHAAGDHDH